MCRMANLVRVAFGRYASHEHAGLQEMVQDFLQQNKEKDHGCMFWNRRTGGEQSEFTLRICPGLWMATPWRNFWELIA